MSVQFVDLVRALGGIMHGSVCINLNMHLRKFTNILRSLKQDQGDVTRWLAKNQTKNVIWFPHKAQCETRVSVTTWIFKNLNYPEGKVSV